MKNQMLETFEQGKEKIGELLLKHTSLTREQLDEALDIQMDSGLLIGEILLKKNYIHPHDITKVICHQIHIPYESEIDVDSIDPELILNIPINYAKTHELIPVLETQRFISVIMTDPFNFDAINDLREIFKKDIQVSVAPPLKVNDAINRVY